MYYMATRPHDAAVDDTGPYVVIHGRPARLTRISNMTPQYSHLLPPTWKSQVVAWLDEDIPSFDYGGFVVGEAQREAFLLGKGSKRTVLAGAPFVDEIFRLLDCMYVWAL
jgi:hypothetical protein